MSLTKSPRVEESGSFIPPVAGGVVSVLGGPFAPVLLATVNARRLARFRSDRPWLAFAAALAVATLLGVSYVALRSAQVEHRAAPRPLLLVGPLLSLCLWGALCLRQREAFKTAMPLRGVSLLGRGLFAWLVAIFLQFALSAVFTLVTR